MTPERRDPASPTPPSRRGLRILAEAADALRVHTPTGWQTVRSDLIALARSAHRPSDPVLGEHDLGGFLLAGDVLTAELRTAVDALADATATSVSLRIGTDRQLEKVTVEVAALFGAHLPSVARSVRRSVSHGLDDLLGARSPGPEGVDVHVHVADVVVDLSTGR